MQQQQATETLGNTTPQVLEVVRSLQQIVEKLDNQFALLSPELKEGITKTVPHAERGVQILNVVREALGQIVTFLESPLCPATAVLIRKHADKLFVMVEVMAGIMLSSLFVVVVGRLIVVNKGEFDSAKDTINSCQQFVREQLPVIEQHVIDASDDLRRLRDAMDACDTMVINNLFWHFENNLREAKIAINICEKKLEMANKKIDEALAKIGVQMKLRGVIRGGSIAGCLIWTYFLIKWKTVPIYAGVVFAVGSCAAGLAVMPPVYNSMEKDFRKYKDIHEWQHSELGRLKWSLEQHEQKYREDFSCTHRESGGEPNGRTVVE